MSRKSMSREKTYLPELVPVLSAGRHRNPRKGACFMEMASFLAGERWSDHPSCTHPLLASLARLVNDALPDADRSRLVTLVPDVVGLTGTDLDLDLAIAARAAAAALPVAPAVRQNVLAVGLLTAQRVAAQRPGVRDLVDQLCADAFATAPDAQVWAQRYARGAVVSERTYRRQTAPHTVAYAVEGLAVACVPDVPDRLVTLLEQVVADVAARTAVDHATPQRESVPALVD
ncbi:hypothetical protein SAMN04489867_2889 [Pedococcus dokdonensis]|uniref:Uncharacterized protein n=1 Tax=Pedococcus dokdonensis TaxID=443156 RepID=A0A1H0TMV2_9MICO|nr:hypothetical protein [Pedococcus dokdonensis]SDP55191.1 hypothetical protein SAMN04489867_2889 [Pedococcus dokdonensis]